MINTEQRSEIVKIFPIESTPVVWQKSELDYLSQRLLYITKKIEVRIKNLELAIKTIANPDKKETMESNRSQIIQLWYENCKRLGAIPVALFRCKIYGLENQTYYWEFPNGLTTTPPKLS